MITKKGINASPGVAIGPALVLDTVEYRIPQRLVEPASIPQQLRQLDAALSASREEVSELRVAAARRLGEKTAVIFDFHEHFIGDPKLRDAVVELIEKHHYGAAYAFAQVMNQRLRPFREVNDAYLRERVRDLSDIEKRVLRHILGRAREDVARLTEPVIIIANDISPAQAVSFDRKHILGFAVDVGGQTSHMAIIARMQGIPAVVALSDITSEISGGETVILDGTHGIVVVSPDAETLARYQTTRRDYEKFELELTELRDLPAETRDGQRVTLLANIEMAEEARVLRDVGAEGVGLFRTELLFLAGPKAPSEDQQFEAFTTALTAAGGRPVVIRTIDLGSDKLMPSMSDSRDTNPELGLRSLRFCLQHLDMFKSHLRAILRASVSGDARIMFPMISSLMELRQAKAALADVMEDLDEEGVPFRRDIPIGMMIETPAAALLAPNFAREVNFLSLGTNDLTQYTLAVDRGNQRVAHLYSPHSPAVLRLIRYVIRAARHAGIPVSLCGEMAGSPIYGQLLVGLGLRTLSMAPRDVLPVKKLLRNTTLERCRMIARRVMAFDSDRQTMAFLRDETPDELEDI